MGIPLVFVSVLVCYCLAGLIVGVRGDGDRLTRIEDRVTQIENQKLDDIHTLQTIVQEMSDDIKSYIKNVLGDVKTTCTTDSSVNEIREEILALKETVNYIVNFCSQNSENIQPIPNQPPTTQPPTTQPVTTQPPTTQPPTTQPVTTQPSTTQSPRPSHCQELHQTGTRLSGAYTIYPEPDKHPLLVYCDMATDGGGWTVFQRREDGSEDFYRGWADYATGFGDVEHEHWLGNEYMHTLTASDRNEIRVDLVDTRGKRTFAKYSYFRVLSSVDNYRMEVGGFSGDAGDTLSYGMQFSTKDRDNDKWPRNCAMVYGGAWWYNACIGSNINARYTSPYMFWKNGYRLSWTEMKFRPRCLNY